VENNPFFEREDIAQLNEQIMQLNTILSDRVRDAYHRTLPAPELYCDRWDKAERLGFGPGSNIYDSSYVFGEVNVGINCWIGMFTVLDGSGGVRIGNNCTISAGVHIYSHDNVKATLCPENHKIERESVVIGDHCYIGPMAIVSKGVVLGHHCVVAAKSFVKNSFPSYSIVAGTPARKIGIVELNEKSVSFRYDVKH
jgi:acetyltransferase-like isoleucine patch superfamily enzyme